MLCACNCREPMCTCSATYSHDRKLLVGHLSENLAFTRYELHYHTLTPEKGRALCLVGRCRKCGRRLCLGTPLPASAAPEELLKNIYRSMARCPFLDNGAALRKMFVSCFKEGDRAYVSTWLTKAERQSLLNALLREQ